MGSSHKQMTPICQKQGTQLRGNGGGGSGDEGGRRKGGTEGRGPLGRGGGGAVGGALNDSCEPQSGMIAVLAR